MIRAVVFDFRDTLLRVDRSFAAGNRTLFAAIKRYRTVVSRAEFDATMEHAIADVKRKYAGNPDIHDWNRLFIRRFLFLHNILVSAAELDRLAKAYHRAFADAARLYPDAKTVLETLRRRKIKMAVVIDGTEYRERRILRRLKLNKYFSSIAISEQVGKNKFTPLPLRRALAELKTRPAETLVVGDRIDKDIIHANRLGCVSVKLERKAGRFTASRDGRKIARPNHIIKNLNDILPLVV